MIHGGLLYRYMKTPTGDSEPILCIPTSKIDIFLDLFHSLILGGHMGMSKSILTLQQRFYCPNLVYHVRMYIISCHVCQTFKHHKRFDRPSKEGLLISMLPHSLIYPWILSICPLLRTNFYIFWYSFVRHLIL